MDFKELIIALSKINEELREHSIRAVNTSLTLRNWFFGFYPAAANLVATNNQIRGLLPPELLQNKDVIIKTSNRESKNPELNIPDTHYFNLFNRISYTHFVELIRQEDPLKRLFYELECIKGAWSVKELKRQIGSLLYEEKKMLNGKKSNH